MIIPIQVKMTVSENKPISLSINESNEIFKLGLAAPIQMVNANTYAGDYTVTPLAKNEVILETKDKVCTDDITVIKIPRYSTSNQYGTTFYIAEV